MKKKRLLECRKWIGAGNDIMKAWCEVEKIEYKYAGETVFVPHFAKLIQAAGLDVDGERILQVDIFCHATGVPDGFVDEPRYILFISKEKKEWITYETTEEKWRTAKYDYLDDGNRYTWWSYESKRTKEIIKNYFDAKETASGYQAIIDFQREIQGDALARRHRKETDEIDEAMDTVPKIPSGFMEWAENIGMMESRYIYYEYSRNVKEGYCTHCKKMVPISKPKHNLEGTCKRCKSKITFKAVKKSAIVYDMKELELLQKTTDNRFVIRRFSAWKSYKDYKNPIFDCQEIGRRMLNPYMTCGSSYIWDFYKQTGQQRWCNYMGWGQYSSRGRLYTYNLKEVLKETSLKYVPIGKFYTTTREDAIEVDEFLHDAERRPVMFEFLIKGRLYNLTRDILRKGFMQTPDCGVNGLERKPTKFLQIPTEQIRILQELDGGTNMLRHMQEANEYGVKLTKEQIKLIDEMKLERGATRFMKTTTPHKMLKYLQEFKEQVGKENWGDSWNRRNTGEYFDYLRMREECGYDMTDSIVLYPKDLKEAHDKMVEETHEREAALRLAEVKKKFPQIAKNFKKLDKKMHEERAGLVIRPARSAEEIIKEGKTLHHCVGGDNYLRKHNDGKTYILMLRKEKSKAKPYVTVEISPDFELKQWYGIHDTKPDEKKIDKWIKDYLKKMKKKQPIGAETEEIIQAAV